MAFSTFDALKNNAHHIQYVTKHGYDLERGIDQRHPINKNSLLENAIIDGEENIVKILIESKAEINPADQFVTLPKGNAYTYKTPLQLAVFLKRRVAVKHLLDHKADINLLDRSDKSYLSILMSGAYSGDCKILSMLLDAKADIYQENTDTLRQKEKYMTALMYATTSNMQEAAIFLLDQGAHIKNSQGKSVFEYCDSPLLEKAIKKYINQHTTATYGLATTLDNLAIPRNLIELICSYSRGFSFIEKTEELIRSHQDVDPTPKKALTLRQHSHSHVSISSISETAQPRVSSNQSAFFMKKASAMPSIDNILAAVTTPNDPTSQITALTTLAPRRKRCDYVRFRRTVASFFSGINVRAAEIPINKFVRYMRS